MKKMTAIKRTPRSIFAGLMLSAMAGLFLGVVGGGAGGCGGSANNNQQPADQAGLSIFKVSAMPVFSGFYNRISFFENQPGPPALKTTTSIATGKFCSSFCYLKGGVLEAIRHSENVDFFLCLARKASEFDGSFDIPSQTGCQYFEITPPALNLSSNIVEGLPNSIQFRLCHNGNQVKIHQCGEGTLEEEAIFDNDPSSKSVTGSLFQKFADSPACDEKSKINFSSNCKDSAFTDSACQASMDVTYCDCPGGNGTILYDVFGGSTNRVTLEEYYAIGDPSRTMGQYSSCGFGDWTASENGCFTSSDSGSYDAIPASEVPLSLLEGCKSLIGTASLCPNPNFNLDSFNALYPLCPFVAASGSTCSFVLSDLECCSVSGETLQTQVGKTIDPSTVADLRDSVAAHTCSTPPDCSNLSFQETWDCRPESGRQFTKINLNQASQVDFSECVTYLTNANSPSTAENCDEQEADDTTVQVQSDLNAMTHCQNSSQCGSAESCHIINATTGDGVCVTTPPPCNITNNNSDCPSDTVCGFDSEFGNARCIPSFVCSSSCSTDTPCDADTGTCKAVTCSPNVGKDCDNKLGPGFRCDSPSNQCVLF